MTDCPNARMRDLLPDFVHGSLRGEGRAEVEAHLETCASCTAEVTLLRSVRAALSRPPALDPIRIASAIPPAASVPRRAEVPMAWRRAAVIVIVALGGLSVLVLRDGVPGRGTDDRARMARTDTVPAPRRDVVVPAPTARPAVAQAPVSGAPAVRVASAGGTAFGMSFVGGMSDLSSAELELLLSELDTFDGVIAEEPIEMLPELELGDG